MPIESLHLIKKFNLIFSKYYGKGSFRRHLIWYKTYVRLCIGATIAHRGKGKGYGKNSYGTTSTEYCTVQTKVHKRMVAAIYARRLLHSLVTNSVFQGLQTYLGLYPRVFDS